MPGGPKIATFHLKIFSSSQTTVNPSTGDVCKLFNSICKARIADELFDNVKLELGPNDVYNIFFLFKTYKFDCYNNLFVSLFYKKKCD